MASPKNNQNAIVRQDWSNIVNIADISQEPFKQDLDATRGLGDYVGVSGYMYNDLNFSYGVGRRSLKHGTSENSGLKGNDLLRRFLNEDVMALYTVYPTR